MYRLLTFVGLWACGGLLLGQVERIYDPEGHILAINPINEEGLYEGVGYTFYPNGTVAKETPYQAGDIDGVERTYYEGEQLKAETPYVANQKHGWETSYYINGSLSGSVIGSMGC